MYSNWDSAHIFGHDDASLLYFIHKMRNQGTQKKARYVWGFGVNAESVSAQ